MPPARGPPPSPVSPASANVHQAHQGVHAAPSPCNPPTITIPAEQGVPSLRAVTLHRGQLDAVPPVFLVGLASGWGFWSLVAAPGVFSAGSVHRRDGSVRKEAPDADAWPQSISSPDRLVWFTHRGHPAPRVPSLVGLDS